MTAQSICPSLQSWRLAVFFHYISAFSAFVIVFLFFVFQKYTKLLPVLFSPFRDVTAGRLESQKLVGAIRRKKSLFWSLVISLTTNWAARHWKRTVGRTEEDDQSSYVKNPVCSTWPDNVGTFLAHRKERWNASLRVAYFSPSKYFDYNKSAVQRWLAIS